MALVRAHHDVYGDVTVPQHYLDRWPDAYKPAGEKPADVSPPQMFEDMTVAQLNDLLESRGLPTDGVKADKIARLSE